MIKLIIKNIDGSIDTKEISKDTTLSPEKGQQFYFDNSDGSRKYMFNLYDGDSSIKLVFIGNNERIKLNLKGMVDLIKQSDNALNEKTKTVLGIMNDRDGLKELNDTALNINFQGDKVISELKKLLADTNSSNEDYQNGIIIDDFGALAEQLDATLAGEQNSINSFYSYDAINFLGRVYNIDRRGRGNNFDDELTYTPATNTGNPQKNFAEIVITSDIKTVFENGLDNFNDDSEISNGTFTIESPAKIVTLKIGGVEFTQAELFATNVIPFSSIDTKEGIINITGYRENSNSSKEISYEYILKDNLNHIGTNDEIITDLVSIEVENLNGNRAIGQLQIRIIDDVPTIDIGVKEVKIVELRTQDEDTIGSNSDIAIGSFSNQFTLNQDMGADDTGTLASLIYTLSIRNINTSLTSNSEVVILSLNSLGVIEGITLLGEVIFTISVDETTGEVTLTQNKVIDHNNENADGDSTNNDINSFGLTTGNIILTVTGTVIDGDGDFVPSFQNLDISSAISFDDDTPSIDITKINEIEPILIVDETELDTDATVSFAEMFAVTSDSGADMEQSLVTTYVLDVKALNTDSGIVDTQSAKRVILNVNSVGEIEGRTEIGEELVFKVSVNSLGEITLDQIRAVKHLDIMNPNDEVSLSADDLITLTAISTIVDKDGDSAIDRETINIGNNLVFKDDTPSSQPSNSTIIVNPSSINLVLTLDVSGSMGFETIDSNGNISTRLEIAKASLIETIQAYATKGQTAVNITLFSADSDNFGWMSPSEAITFINGLSMPGEIIFLHGEPISSMLVSATDYYDGLNETMRIDFSEHDAEYTIAYFLSDGEPNHNSNRIDEDNDQTIINWKKYVEDNIDRLNVVGIGSGAVEGPLKIIQVQDSDEVLMVKDPSELGEILLGTVDTVSGLLNFHFGVDGSADGVGIKNDDNKEAFTWGNPIATDLLGNDVSVSWTMSQNNEILIGKINDEIVIKVEAKNILLDNPIYEISQLAKSIEITDLIIPYTVTDGDGNSVTTELIVEINGTNSEVTENINELNTVTNIFEMVSDNIDLSSTLTNYTSNNIDIVNMTDKKVNNLDIDLTDIIILDDKLELDESKIFREKVDKVTFEEETSNLLDTYEDKIKGEVFNIYQSTNGISNMKVLIDEDVFVDSNL